MAEQQATAGTVDVRFHRVSKRFGEVAAVAGVSFEIPRGSFHSFLGPSGCGKTTTLRLIAGFEQPDEGEVAIAGQPMVGIPAYRRPVNMVFQHYALFAHMTVAENVGYGLRQRRPRLDRGEIERRSDAALELVRLPGIAPDGGRAQAPPWQEGILLLNHNREIKRAGSVIALPAHAISTKNKHLLVIYSIPTRGFTAAVSVFRGTPPPKPLDCKV